MTIRESLELREKEYLSPLAAFSMDSRGRQRAEEPCDIRPVFQTFSPMRSGKSWRIRPKSFLKNRVAAFILLL